MSRLKIFDSIIDKARDWWRGVMYRIGTGVGESKHRSILDYKSDLNDPDYWNSVPNFGPEDGGEQVYGTNVFAEDFDFDALHGPTIEPWDTLKGARPAVNTKVRERDLHDLERRNVFGIIRPDAPENDTKLINPLGSLGITSESVPRKQDHFTPTQSLQPALLFDDETKHYIKNASVVPSWFESKIENPTRNNSKVGHQRDQENVRIVSYWPEGEPTDSYLKENTGTKPYLFANDFQVETAPKVLVKKLGIQRQVTSGFSTETSLPRDVVAVKNYQTSLDKYNHPGGQQVDSVLEYDKKYEEALGLIPFCITTLTPNHRTYLNFPAYLESYSDSYNGNWDSTQYVGRAENFYGYTGFKRNISISFKVAIFRKEDATEMYHRLNRLVGATAPSYDSTRLFMRGTLASLTIGDLLRHKDGFIENISIKWQQDYPWEIGEVSGSNIPAGEYRVPHILDVDLQFVPIEDKTVTEDNGDYFVFITEPPKPKEIQTKAPAEIKKQEAAPSTKRELIPRELPKFEVQIDHTAVDVLQNVSGGGGGKGNNRVKSVSTRILGKTAEALSIEESIFKKSL